jgi:hypothetical protein
MKQCPNAAETTDETISASTEAEWPVAHDEPPI